LRSNIWNRDAVRIVEFDVRFVLPFLFSVPVRFLILLEAQRRFHDEALNALRP
jgi:hypothetical protein